VFRISDLLARIDVYQHGHLVPLELFVLPQCCFLASGERERDVTIERPS
jgi:hypothetical protein